MSAVERMIVRKVRMIAPRTPTWTVEDPDGYDYQVVEISEDDTRVLACVAHGKDCAHVTAVREHLAAKRR